MEVLLVEKDPLIRDQIKMGLQQFPEFEVAVGTGQAGINQMRGRHFGCVFLGVDPRQKDTVKLLHNLRQIDQTAEVFVVTPAKNVRDMQVDKSKFDIHSFLQTPLDLKDTLEHAFVTQAAGYYDPTQKKFFIVVLSSDDTMLDTITSHELMHGLQDQYFEPGRHRQRQHQQRGLGG